MVKKAGTILINKDLKSIGLVRRTKHNDVSFPKGHLEKGETLKECAIRETLEETGRDSIIIKKDPVYIMKYSSKKEKDVELYFFLAEDLGEIRKDIDEELIWVKYEEVNSYLTYDELKKCFREIYDKYIKYL
ncbi:MAG: NUDIX domain-containing protein [Bacilli bacterium]|nr:NUDIX domain-containing protein [Bacilli bacterium]